MHEPDSLKACEESLQDFLSAKNVKERKRRSFTGSLESAKTAFHQGAGSSSLFKMGVVTDEKQQSSQVISFWNSHQHNQTLPGFLGAVSSIHVFLSLLTLHLIIYNYKKNINVRQSQGLIFNHLILNQQRL